ACAKTFSTSGNLSRHIRTQHRGESRAGFGIKPSTAVGRSFQFTGGAPYQPLAMPSLTLPAKMDYYDSSPIDIYSQGLLHQQHRLLPQVPEAVNHVQEGMSDNDVMLLLDCLFVNDASRASASASTFHSSRGFQQQHQHAPPHGAFEVYF
ncbi:Zinc finger protein, partial [Globisporangium polare]